MRMKPGTSQQVPYRRGPFCNQLEWDIFRTSKHWRLMELNHVLVDEDTTPPTVYLYYSAKKWPLSDFKLPYPFLISKYDGALLTGEGKLIFAGPSQPNDP